LGNSYQNLAQFKNASRAYFEALQVLKNEPDSLYMQRMQAEVYINLGIVYFEQKFYEKSIETYNVAKTILEDQQLKPQLATVYNNLAVVYTEIQDFNIAAGYLLIADSLNQAIKSEVGLAICTNNLAKIFREQQQYTLAIDKHKQAIDMLQNIGDQSYLPSCYLGLGKTYTLTNLYNEAHISLLRGLQIALKSGQKVQELRFYEGLIDLHKSANQMEETIMYYDLYSALSQELNDQQIGRYIGQQELREHIEKRDQALKTLESEAAFLQFKLNQRNMLLIMSGALIALVSLLFTLLFQQYRLKTENRSIALEQKILRAQLNPHFIFNALGAIQHYMIDHRPEKAASYLSKFSKLMRAILEGSRSGKTPLSVELENIRHYLDLQALRFSKPFEYSIEIDDHIDPKQVHIPPLLVQPLLENAIEHGLLPNQGGELVVRFKRNDPFILVEIQDDGIGIARRSNVDSVQPKKSGLGNIIVNERLMLLNRKIQKKMRLNISNRSNLDQNNHGTIASFMIPITP
jgi:tetratricopeptide (TPR) repeat protein